MSADLMESIEEAIERKRLAIAAASKPGVKRMYFRGSSGTGKTYCLTKVLLNLVEDGHTVVCYNANEMMYRVFLAELEKRKNEENFPEALKEPKALLSLEDLPEIHAAAEAAGHFYNNRYQPRRHQIPQFRVLIGHEKHPFFRQLVGVSPYSAVLFDGLGSITLDCFERFVRPPNDYIRETAKFHSGNRLIIGTIDNSQRLVHETHLKAVDLIDRNSRWVEHCSDVNTNILHSEQSMPRLFTALMPSLKKDEQPPNFQIPLFRTNRPHSLIAWSSAYFYENRLVGNEGPNALKFIDTSLLRLTPDDTIHMTAKKIVKKGPVSNPKEAELAVEEAERLIKDGVEPNSIGIMAQDKMQVETIRDKLRASEIAQGVRVDETFRFFYVPCEHGIFTQTVSLPDFRIPFGQLTLAQANMVFQRATRSLTWIGNGEMLERNAERVSGFGNLLSFLKGEPIARRAPRARKN